MKSNNRIKSEQLKMPYGTASQRLRKNIMFDLVKKCGLDICYQCGKKIENIDDLSIEHKTPWLHSDDPEGLFYDMNNIAFSHLKCNTDNKRHATRKVRIGKTGYIGVHYESSQVKNYTNRYRASVNNKTLGRFFTAEEAAIEVDKELIKIYGQDTIINKSLGLIK